MTDFHEGLTQLINRFSLRGGVESVGTAGFLRIVRDELERLEDRLDQLREVSECPPDCDLLTWVRTLADCWNANAEKTFAVHAKEPAKGA